MVLRKTLFFVFILLGIQSWAQENRYVIHFTDKMNSEYTVDEPIVFLTQRVIDRRFKQGIAITESDLPVNSSYVDGVKATGADVYFTSKWMNAALVQMDTDLVDDVEALAYVDEVVRVANGIKLTPGNTNIDNSGPPIIGQNTNSRSSDLQNEVIGIQEMHNMGYLGENMLVAVMDGGFRSVNRSEFFAHLYTNNQIVDTYDFVRNEIDVYDYSNHGTRVFSCLAAKFEDDYTGTAPEADYLLYATEETDEFLVEEYNFLLACERADSLGVDVITTSLGYSDEFTDPTMDHTPEEMDGETTVMTQAAVAASQRGIAVVCSAGNSGDQPWKIILAPADAAEVLSVGAVNANLDRAGFSSMGPTADGRIKPDVMAIGSGTVVCTDESNLNITVSSGTSFAAPQVAGLVIGLWQANPDLSAAEILDRIRSTASLSLTPDNFKGYGVPDFLRAHNEIILGLEEDYVSDILVYPNPIKDGELVVTSERQNLRRKELSLYSSEGKIIPISLAVNRPGKVVIDVSNFTTGVFYLSLVDENRKEVIRVVKF